MKQALASALLIFGSTMVAAPASAADKLQPPPMVDEMPPPVTDYGPTSETATDTAAPAVAPETETPPSAPSPVADKVAAPPPCTDCATSRRYDSEQIIKKIRQIDRSRTINTTEIAPEAPRPPSPRYRIREDVTLVNFVTHHYRVIYSPGLVPAVEVGGDRPRLYDRSRVACRYGEYRRHGSCRPVLRVGG